jgi:hypothetical protein
MIRHLFLHCLEEASADLEACCGTALDGERIRRSALEHRHATARLEKRGAEAAILGTKYARMPSASPDHVAAVRATAPPRRGHHDDSSDTGDSPSDREQRPEGRLATPRQREMPAWPDSGRGSEVLDTDVAGRPSTLLTRDAAAGRPSL